MSWIIEAIEAEAEIQAAKRLVDEATLDVYPNWKEPGWVIEVEFGEGMEFVRFDMERILHEIEHQYDDCVKSQIINLEKMIAAFGLTIDRLQLMLDVARTKLAAEPMTKEEYAEYKAGWLEKNPNIPHFTVKA